MNTRHAATIGFFDGVHLGHRYLTRQLTGVAEEAGLCPLLVTFDRHPLEIVRPEHAPHLLTTNEERLSLLKALPDVRVEVLRFTEEMSRMSARDFMRTVLCERLGVEVLLMGYDHRFGHGGGCPEDYRKWGEEVGVRVVFADEREGKHVSSSTIRRLVKDGCVDEAAGLLGYRFFLEGEVVGGKQLGRQIGFPTANIALPGQKLMPGCGVYAVVVQLPGGQRRGGMLCVGRRPTVDDHGAVSIEVNIFDFEGDIYGQQLRIELAGRLRAEQQFASIEALREQLGKDAVAARRMLEGAI